MPKLNNYFLSVRDVFSVPCACRNDFLNLKEVLRIHANN